VEYGIENATRSFLKDHPSIIHAANRQRSTALHLAPLATHPRYGSSGAIDLLLAAGADALARDCHERTLLHHVLSGKMQHLAFIQCLKTIDDKNGSLVLDQALQAIRPELVGCVGGDGASWDENK
jgi:ankyrin repeat protein